MEDEQAYVDRCLDEVIKDFHDAEKYRESRLRSYDIRKFYNFDKGSRVSMILTKVTLGALNNIYIRDTQRVEGFLVDPWQLLVDIKYTEDLDEWTDRTVGLATRVEVPIKGIPNGVYPHLVGGDQGVSYFYEEDMEPSRIGKPTIPTEKIHHLALRYGKVAVDGLTLFDFTKNR
jgi:hypothetical protein